MDTDTQRPRSTGRTSAPGPDTPEPSGGVDPDTVTPLDVTARDFAIFQVKLLLDGLKDFILFNLSIGAFALDVVSGRGRRRFFYRVMELGERVDLWLNLHGAAGAAESTGDGLFGASRAGSETLLGTVEQWVRGGDDPRPLRESIRHWVHVYGEEAGRGSRRAGSGPGAAGSEGDSRAA